MAQVLLMFNPENYKLAHQRIKKLWREGNTVIGIHAQEKMAERFIDINDIQHVVTYGSIIEHSKPATYWRYTIAGKAVDGEAMKCVVEINGTLIIVTVI